MARTKSGDKRGDIRRAAVAELVESGLGAVSVNRIATRANLSVGTLYRYFENKEVLLGELYLEIKQEIHAVLVEALESEQSSEQRLRAAWFALLDYATVNPNDFIFSEALGQAEFLTNAQAKAVERLGEDLRGYIQSGIDDGTLRAEPVSAIITAFTAPALHLARQHALKGAEPDAKLRESVFTMCWRAVANYP